MATKETTSARFQLEKRIGDDYEKRLGAHGEGPKGVRVLSLKQQIQQRCSMRFGRARWLGKDLLLIRLIRRYRGSLTVEEEAAGLLDDVSDVWDRIGSRAAESGPPPPLSAACGRCRKLFVAADEVLTLSPHSHSHSIT